jgi:hypothetical protein
MMTLALARATELPAALLAHAAPIHRAGLLEVRLAASEAEIIAAQALRYAIFYDEMGALPTPAMRCARALSAPIGCCGRTWQWPTAASIRRASSTCPP